MIFSVDILFVVLCGFNFSFSFSFSVAIFISVDGKVYK